MEERFETFTVLMTKISRYIHKIKSEEMSAFFLKGPHVSCLYYLYKEQTLTAKALCDICEEDKGAVSRSVEYLEEDGYIACNSTAKKRYNAAFVLTEKGRDVAEKIAQKIDTVLDQAGKGLAQTERENMYKSLSLVCDNLQKICQKYGEE